MVYAFWHVEESTWVTLNLAEVESRSNAWASLSCAQMKIAKKNVASLSWDKVRRAQTRWSVGCEECSVKCGAWRAQCEVWSLECEECSEKGREECSVKCEVWSLKSTVWSEVLTAKGAVWRVQCEVWTVKCEDCQLWSVKWSFKCDMWNKTPLSQSARTHGLGWRTAHASSIDEKGLIYIFKATSAPPRAGTTGKVLI